MLHDFVSMAAGWGMRLALWTWLFIQPAREAMIFLVAIILIDCVTGVWASLKRGDKVTVSYLMRSTVTSKILPYWVAIIATHLVEQKFLPDVPLMKSTAAFLAVAELGSTLSNLGAITGLKIWDAIKNLLQPAAK
jgi:hypothetical protein